MAAKPVKKEGTILFCDIRNFTSLFDERDPIEAVQFANSVLAVLGEVVEEHGGVVDRFTGDGFLSHFGFKNDMEAHTHKACRASIGIRKKLTEINSMRYLEMQPVIGVGISIHTDIAAYCEIETKQFSQTTVLGDAVNTAARLEELTKDLMVDVILSESSYEIVAQDFKFQKMPERKLRGKKESFHSYWLLPLNF